MWKIKARKRGSWISSYIVGGLTGAALALLIAPQSGEQFRAQIRDKSSEIKDKALNTIEETRNRVEEKVQSAKLQSGGSLNEVIESVEDSYKEAADRAEDKTQSARNRAESKLREAKESAESALQGDETHFESK